MELVLLMQECTMPAVCMVHGQARGSGMLFPALADVITATEGAYLWC